MGESRTRWESFCFYGAGKASFTRSDINFSNMHQGFGGGLGFFVARRVVFRAYVGLGAGEGAHPFSGIANFAFKRRFCKPVPIHVHASARAIVLASSAE